MTVHNHPDGYPRFPASEPHIIDYSGMSAQSVLQDGLFYRSDLLGIHELESSLLTGDGAVQDYQRWVDSGWKREHGTSGAAERFMSKLEEEFEEFATEIKHHAMGRGSAEEIIGEAGDVIWCTTALTSCLGGDLGDGMKSLLYHYTAGVQLIDEQGRAMPPSWRPTAAQLAIAYEPTDIKGLDELIAAHFEPLPSPVMNIFDDGYPEVDPYEHLITMAAHTSALISHANRIFQPEENSAERRIINGGMPEYGRTAAELAANIYLETAWIVHHITGVRLADIIRINVQKISGRIANNQVDKTDNPRERRSS